MLDDLKFIHEKDAQDALGVTEKQYAQLEGVYTIPAASTQIDHVVVAGMGGSALAAQIAVTWPGVPVPYEICRNYEIPAYVSQKTLFIASSYSGNTEETLEALTRAEAKGAQIVVISAGGKLRDRAQEKGYPYAELPAGFQPRHAVLANFKALLTIFDAYGVTTGKADELAAASGFLRDASLAWRPDVATKQNQAKQIAQELMGKSVVVYAGPKFYPVAYKWKINFNENAKQIAWVNQYPEFNHNEFLGWTEQPVDKPYAVIDIRSSFEHPRVLKRFEVSERLLSGRRPASMVITPEGGTLLEQILWTIALGDFVSVYLALLNGLNPSPVDLIEKLKKALTE